MVRLSPLASAAASGNRYSVGYSPTWPAFEDRCWSKRGPHLPGIDIDLFNLADRRIYAVTARRFTAGHEKFIFEVTVR